MVISEQTYDWEAYDCFIVGVILPMTSCWYGISRENNLDKLR